MAPETFLLKWKKTWPDRTDDFTARVPDHPDSFIRVYRQKATSDPARAWLWIVTMRGERVASGHEADGPEGARPAVRAAEKAWAEWKGRADSQSG
jgi:hypothetical protein